MFAVSWSRHAEARHMASISSFRHCDDLQLYLSSVACQPRYQYSGSSNDDSLTTITSHLQHVFWLGLSRVWSKEDAWMRACICIEATTDKSRPRCRWWWVAQVDWRSSRTELPFRLQIRLCMEKTRPYHWRGKRLRRPSGVLALLE